MVIVLLATAGSSKSAVNYTHNGVKVYGAKGPEGIPLELGTPLAPANAKLTGATIAGVQCNKTEQPAYHHHVHVALFVNGAPRPIPLGVGMAPKIQVEHTKSGDLATGSSSCLYWLQVHAQDGIVHIESPVARTFVLGQVFQLWNEPLSSTQLGPYKGTVVATVNGKRWTEDPTQIPLNEHTQIVLNLGGPVVQPPPVSWSGTSL